MVRVDCNNYPDINTLLKKEWLDTNGLGSYASSTILNCHSRKYHGLLVSNLDIPGGRFVLLSKLEDSIVVYGKEFFLSVHKYPMGFSPSDQQYLEQFTQDLYPRFTYRIGEIILHKELMLVHGENTLLIRYYLENAPVPVLMRLKPLLAYRGIHELTGENDFLRSNTYNLENGFSISPYEGMPDIYFQTNEKSRFHPSFQWYKNFEYLEERDRGFPYQEDLFVPGKLECSMSHEKEIMLCVSLSKTHNGIASLWKKESGRRKKPGKKTGRKSDLEKKLNSSARHFIIKDREDRSSVVAGYHWFYEWGRDTLISLPGLTFYTGRIKEGVEILQNIAELRKDGLIPNCLSEKDEHRSYNSVDASLWYFWCVQEYLKKTGDLGFVKKYFWPVLIDIIINYYHGTPEHISFLDNGLLRAGDHFTQLTWMDAMVHGIPVTPRNGCPVEINALWFNALCFTRELSEEFDIKVEFDINRAIQNISDSFIRCFWIEDKNYLADLYMPDTETRDESVRPNQIFAASLPYSTLSKHKMLMVVKKVTEDLLTPYGLRTLSPFDSRYRGTYSGSPEQRDSSYHQGTVWPWLSGHYGEALLKSSENRSTARKQLKNILKNMEEHLLHAGLGHISEIFSGDYPHDPCGCIAQAWSVAETIRLCNLIL
jgi:predicted glycogen debranching enzyme